MSAGLSVLNMPSPLVFMPLADKSPDITGTPSSTYRGSLEAEREPMPRILIEELAPGVPLFVVIDMPDRLPSIICDREMTGRSFCLSTLITEADPV